MSVEADASDRSVDGERLKDGFALKVGLKVSQTREEEKDREVGQLSAKSTVVELSLDSTTDRKLE